MNVTKILIPVLALSLSAASAQTVNPQTIRVSPTPSVSNLELGLTGGYYNGGGAQVYVGARNIAGPLGVRLSASFAGNNGGFDESVAMPLLGTIAQQKASGIVTGTTSKSTTVGLDATYGLGRVAQRTDATVYGGLRYGNFKSTLESGSSSTDYTSNAFGLGAGVEVGYALNRNLSAIANVGADYYFKGDVKTDDNKGNTDTLTSDNAKFVSRPGAMLKAGLGLRYRF